VSTTLRVFVGEQWPERPGTRWVLLDAAGDLLQQGESDALHWPVADYCEAVMSAPELSCLRAEIPQRVSRRDLPQVVGGVLEDQLLEDPDRCHLTLCAPRRDSVDVLVLARTRLRNVMAQFTALGRPLSAAYSELQTLPTDLPEWTVALAADAAILGRPNKVPLALDAGSEGSPPMLLETLARNRDSAAGDLRVTIRPEPGKKVDLAGWQKALGTAQVRIGPEHRWHSVVSGAVDLLHGEFASSQRRNSTWLLVKPAMLVAGTAVLAYLAVGLAQIAFSAYRISQAEGRITDLFRAAFPGVPVVAPVAQTRRQLDQLRAVHGLARSDDPLVLLSAVAEAVGASGENSVRELDFANHRLTVVLEPAHAGHIESLRRQLQDRGYQTTARTTPQNPPSLVIELDMTK
jgi:general secretion pathway protein L